MAKIAIDARELRGSTGRYIERLLHYLQQLDHSNSYVVLLKPQDFDSWQPTNRKFTKIACRFKEFTFGEQIGLLRQIRQLKPDLVHFGMVQQPILYRGPVVTTMMDLTTARFRNPSKNWLVFTAKQQIYRWVNKIVARKSAAILTISQYVKDDVARFAHVNSRKITVTYCAADPITANAEPLPDLVDKNFIMYVGRPQPHKNLQRLVDAFKLLQEKRPDLYLVLAGKRDLLYRRLAWYVSRQNIPNVVFTDFVSDGQLRWLYDHTKAYVFPSLSEGFGLPGLEAMEQGAPVVSSNATCLPEIYGDAAYYFDPLNIEEMSKKILDVLSGTVLRDKLIHLGKKQAAKYSWEATAKATLAVYEEVLSSKNS